MVRNPSSAPVTVSLLKLGKLIHDGEMSINHCFYQKELRPGFGQSPGGDRFHNSTSIISINSQFPGILEGGEHLQLYRT